MSTAEAMIEEQIAAMEDRVGIEPSPGMSLENRVTALEQRIAGLEKARPGRRRKPNVVTQAGVCGVDPESDSATCEYASIYRFQQGCLGEKCVQINTDYYSQYRASKKKETLGEVEEVGLDV